MKTKLPIVQLAVLFLLTAGAVVLFLMTESKIVAVNKLQIEVDRLAANTSKLAGLSSALPAISGEMTNFQRTLPASEADVADFAATVESTARSFGMTIVYQFDDFPKPVDVAGQNISGLGTIIFLEGNFQGLTNFLARLSALPYFFRIDKLTIVKHEAKPVIKVTINGYLMMNIERK